MQDYKPLQGKELQEKEAQKDDQSIREISLERTYS